MMLEVIAAIDEWDALLEREKMYQCNVTNNDNDNDDVSLAQSLYHSYPKAWREKICEWNFKVLDHW